ncbi:MAG: DUF4011 domain-containing protein [Crocinitomicaceae bacterium]|nr:DUF4011 domain-containing protein [Crocinitomicaceae bacterium]
MSSELKNKLQELLIESSSFNVNDVLVHVEQKNTRLYFPKKNLVFTKENIPKKILQQAERSIKESGINTLCLAKGTLSIKHSKRTINSPLVLYPLTIKRDKVVGTTELLIDSDNGFINPFLVNYLQQNFDLVISEELGNDLLSSIIRLLSKHGFILESEILVVGNFHHHRYSVIKELEELIEATKTSNALSQLLGDDYTEPSSIELPKNNLFSADTDHEKVFKSVECSNTVIQGPPGTGKSQILSNLIGKMLSSERSTMVVSEKYSALSVIVNKLSTHQLDKLCFIANSDHLSHSFLQSLKTTWDYFDDFSASYETNLLLSEQLEDQLQMTLDVLSIPNLIGGISYAEFQEISQGHTMEQTYVSNVPEISELQENKKTIEFAFSSMVHTSLGKLKPAVFQKGKITNFDTQIRKWINTHTSLSNYFKLDTWSDVRIAMQEAANCQVFENDLFKQYRSILIPNSKEQKRFLSLRKKQLKLNSQLIDNTSVWKNNPSKIVVTSILKSIREGSYLTKRRARRLWQKLTDFPFSEAESILVNYVEHLHKKEQLSQIHFKFRDLGIEKPEKMVSIIYQSLHHYSEEAWGIYERIPPNKRAKITETHITIHEFWSSCRNFLRLSPNDKLTSIFEGLESHLSILISNREQFSQLSVPAMETLNNCDSFSLYQSRVFSSHLIQFKERFPKLSNFKFSDIVPSIQEILRLQKTEEQLFAKDIEKAVHAKFIAYHELLNTPARKLKEADKQLKNKLKKGKALLVKEFSKTRSHPSLRALFASDARLWIQLLKPVWLSNPSQVAKCFPMEVNLFDTVVFDEASQIPLQNALGSIQRANRIVIAGDDQQMSPSSYFNAGESIPIDLLHQANYQLDKIKLQHHYRSIHSQLIEFSNIHFYDNHLCNYPAPSSGMVISHHYVENALFENRSNKKEATAVGIQIEKALETNKTIGIVAFSEEQLKCIWETLPQKIQTKLEIQLEKNRGFFKALENIQGDECDQLIISFGYGRNNDGDFHMRFGPMNMETGRKRLNVLLTRAKECIHFFCSVHSSNFKLSDNESINLLRKWIQFSERSSKADNLKFPFGLTPVINGNELTFHKIQEVIPNARELVTLHSLLTQRGWIVKYC